MEFLCHILWHPLMNLLPTHHWTSLTIVVHFPNGIKRTVKKIENYIWRLILYSYSRASVHMYSLNYVLIIESYPTIYGTLYHLPCSCSCMHIVASRKQFFFSFWLFSIVRANHTVWVQNSWTLYYFVAIWCWHIKSESCEFRGWNFPGVYKEEKNHSKANTYQTILSLHSF